MTLAIPFQVTNKVVSFFVIGFLLIAAGCSKTPDFQYVSGEPGSYGDLKGKQLVINYWAVWCKPCIEEIPELNELAHELPNIEVIGINYDKKPVDQLKADADKLDIKFPVALADFHQHFGFEFPKVLPTTIIISKEGKPVKTLVGPQTLETLKAALNDHQ